MCAISMFSLKKLSIREAAGPCWLGVMHSSGQGMVRVRKVNIEVVESSLSKKPLI